MSFVKKGKQALKPLRKLIRPLDAVLMIVILLASFIPVGVFAWQQFQTPVAPPGSTIYAVITINGVEYGRFPLYEGASEYFEITSEDGWLIGDQYNWIEIDGEQVRVNRDNSPDQIGVMMGWASRPGQTIIVLPHRLLIHIVEVHPPDYVPDDDVVIPF
ncbi:MAG: NusG domain II-containing protein [Turicibacter sp.]|nr:NusG domain II-containing protein [Turicibacter sp.]